MGWQEPDKSNGELKLIEEELLLEIIDRNRYVWEDRVTRKIVMAWLSNFSGEVSECPKEHSIAIDLLNNFLYYGEKEIKYLCRAAFSLLKRSEIVENTSLYLGTNAGNSISEFIKSCKFSYIGRAGESGALILYHFRQENRLSIEQFAEPTAFLTGEISDTELSGANLVFIDDFLGTGRTACDFWNSKIAAIKERCPRAKFHYLALLATTRALDNVRSRTGLAVICPQILDDSHRVFSETSSVFPDREKRDFAKRVCEFYGCHLAGRPHALGYRNSQTLLGFHHNIPDNTLPVIWSEVERPNSRKWHPLFKRGPKF